MGVVIGDWGQWAVIGHDHDWILGSGVYSRIISKFGCLRFIFVSSLHFRPAEQ